MIVRLSGGLCNQMFMWAFGRALSLERGVPVKYHWARSTWDYALDAYYDAKVDLTTPTSTARIYDELGFAFDYGVFTAPLDTYYRGYWQSEKYFYKYADVIRKELKANPTPNYIAWSLAQELRSQNSVFVHVRRGDYTNPGTKEFHGTLPWEYYRDAMNYMREKLNSPKFYFFSDDTKWVRENFYTDFSLGEWTVISGFNQHEDLYLMQNCRHGIMANSTFGWWANWLGEHPDRVCIAPKRWFMNPDINTNDLIPERWIRI